MFKVYYRLAKPGIIYGNALTALGGFGLASRGQIDAVSLAALLIGSSLIMAAACVVNNYFDRGLDARMVRTERRALVTGRVTPRQALLYASGLGILGTLVLILYSNRTVVVIGLVGFVAYVVLYGYYKRRSAYGTLIGAISGGLPPVAGYAAVTAQLDRTTLLLFAALVCWQMVHFYAIALYRQVDYVAAGVPVWPIARGVQSTYRSMQAYGVGYTLCILGLTLFGGASYSFMIITGALGGWWLAGVYRTNRHLAASTPAWPDQPLLARQIFRRSLIVICAFSGTLLLTGLVP